ncbi:MAG: 50S ribosomal protein L13 [Nitrososphaeria archaeon]
MSNNETIYIDGSGLIMGRLASKIAKLLLEGKKVYVVNAEKILISGNRRSIIEEWKRKLEIKSIINPRHNPIHYRRPDRIFRRVVRGMLPYRKPKGRTAYKNLTVVHGIPEQFKSVKFYKPEEAIAKGFPTDYIMLGELAKELGWNGNVN